MKHNWQYLYKNWPAVGLIVVILVSTGVAALTTDISGMADGRTKSNRKKSSSNSDLKRALSKLAKNSNKPPVAAPAQRDIPLNLEVNQSPTSNLNPELCHESSNSRKFRGRVLKVERPLPLDLRRSIAGSVHNLQTFQEPYEPNRSDTNLCSITIEIEFCGERIALVSPIIFAYHPWYSQSDLLRRMEEMCRTAENALLNDGHLELYTVPSRQYTLEGDRLAGFEGDIVTSLSSVRRDYDR